MTISRHLLLVAVLVIMSCSMATAGGSKLDVRKSDEGGVQVAVTPKVVDATSDAWEFSVSIDTHTKALDTDMAAASQLIADGVVSAAVSWTGDKPGGHHRGGVLKFSKPAGAPTQIEIHIRDLGGVPIRRFHWKLP